MSENEEPENTDELPEVQELRQVLESIRQIDLAKLVKGKNLGPFDFSKFDEEFQEVIDFATDLSGLPLEYLSESEAESWLNTTRAVEQQFDAVRDFDPEEVDSPGVTRDSLARSVTEHFRSLKSNVNPQIPYLLIKREPNEKKNLRTELSSARKMAKEFEEEAARVRDEAESLKTELTAIIEASRTAVGQVGVDAHAEDFSTIAKEHETAAKHWLIATVFGIAVAIVVPLVYLSLFPLDPNEALLLTIQKSVTKLAVLFILYFLIAQCTKNYRTHRHLYVVNKHRETSLKTFQTFVQAATDDQTKTQILVEAAHTVFGPTSTGYVATDDDNPTSRVVEILKMVKEVKP